MSDTLPTEVREAMARAMWAYFVSRHPDPESFLPWEELRPLTQDDYRSHAAAALSALEAAGWEVNRKGTREALEAAARPLVQRLDDLEVEAGGVVPRLLQTAHVYIADLRGLRAALLTAPNPKEKPDV